MTKEATEIFKIVEKTSVDSLLDQALNEKDKDKQDVLLSLYKYEVKKKQQKIINRKEFII